MKTEADVIDPTEPATILDEREEASKAVRVLRAALNLTCVVLIVDFREGQELDKLE